MFCVDEVFRTCRTVRDAGSGTLLGARRRGSGKGCGCLAPRSGCGDECGEAVLVPSKVFFGQGAGADVSGWLPVDAGQGIDCLEDVVAKFGRGEDLGVGAEFEKFG